MKKFQYGLYEQWMQDLFIHSYLSLRCYVHHYIVYNIVLPIVDQQGELTVPTHNIICMYVIFL